MMTALHAFDRETMHQQDWVAGACGPEESPMELQIEQLDGRITCVSAVGGFGIRGIAGIKEQLLTIASSGTRIILDLAEVQYLSSAGIRQLIIASQAAAANGGKLVLMSPVPAVAHVLNTARIGYIIPLCSNLAQAMRVVLASR